MDLFEKFVKGNHLLPYGISGIFLELFQGSDDTKTQGIEGSQLRFVLRGGLLLPAAGVAFPPLFCGPLAAPNVPGEDVVFQAVTFLRGQAGQAGLEIPKDVIVGVAPGHGIQGSGDEGEDGLLQNVGLVRLEEGDVVLRKTIFELLPIAVHRAGGDCDVPIPK